MTVTDADVNALQQAVLNAVLLRQDLPGGISAPSLPDLQMITQSDEILLLDRNLKGALAVEGAAKPFRIISDGDLARLRQQTTQVPYLMFQPPQIDGDQITINLGARLAVGQGTPELGLSNVQVPFRNDGNGWIAQRPFYSAN
jgi:hypothetical protein